MKELGYRACSQLTGDGKRPAPLLQVCKEIGSGKAAWVITFCAVLFMGLYVPCSAWSYRSPMGGAHHFTLQPEAPFPGAWARGRGMNLPESPWILARGHGGRGGRGGSMGYGYDNDWRLRERYREWESFSPEKKRLLRRRMEEWRQLSPRERALMRKRYEQWKRLSPEERVWIQNKLRHWNELSPEEREMIRRKFLQ